MMMMMTCSGAQCHERCCTTEAINTEVSTNAGVDTDGDAVATALADDAAGADAADGATITKTDADANAPTTMTTAGTAHPATPAKTTNTSKNRNTINAIDANDTAHNSLQWCSFHHRRHKRRYIAGEVSAGSSTDAETDAD